MMLLQIRLFSSYYYCLLLSYYVYFLIRQVHYKAISTLIETVYTLVIEKKKKEINNEVILVVPTCFQILLPISILS